MSAISGSIVTSHLGRVAAELNGYTSFVTLIHLFRRIVRSLREKTLFVESCVRYHALQARCLLLLCDLLQVHPLHGFFATGAPCIQTTNLVLHLPNHRLIVLMAKQDSEVRQDDLPDDDAGKTTMT